MLLGTHTPRLDEKGRLVLPAKFRDDLGAGLVMTKGQDRCVVVWPSDQFAKYAAKLDEASRSNSAVRAYLRVLFSGAFDQQPDKQGRVSVPQQLRDYAGLDRDVTIAGNGTTAEIWDGPAWDAYLAEQEAGFAELGEEVVPGLF